VVLAPLGYVTLVAAIVADMGISLLVTLNGLRLLGQGRGRTDAGSGSDHDADGPTGSSSDH